MVTKYRVKLILNALWKGKMRLHFIDIDLLYRDTLKVGLTTHFLPVIINHILYKFIKPSISIIELAIFGAYYFILSVILSFFLWSGQVIFSVSTNWLWYW
jgi:hypothetical protein